MVVVDGIWLVVMGSSFDDEDEDDDGVTMLSVVAPMIGGMYGEFCVVNVVVVVVGSCVVMIIVVIVVLAVVMAVVGRSVVHVVDIVAVVSSCGVVVIAIDVVIGVSSTHPTTDAKSHGGLAGLKASPFGHLIVLTLPWRQMKKYAHPSGCFSYVLSGLPTHGLSSTRGRLFNVVRLVGRRVDRVGRVVCAKLQLTAIDSQMTSTSNIIRTICMMTTGRCVQDTVSSSLVDLSL